MKPLTERMTKGGAAKTWIAEVEAKDRDIERLEQTKDQYLNTIDFLACEKEQLKRVEIAAKAVCDCFGSFGLKADEQEIWDELENSVAALTAEESAEEQFANSLSKRTDPLTGDEKREALLTALLTEEHDDQT